MKLQTVAVKLQTVAVIVQTAALGLQPGVRVQPVLAPAADL